MINKINPSVFKGWEISIELCGGIENHLDYFYSSKSNKYKTIYFYFFVNNSINGLTCIEKEIIIFTYLFKKINSVLDKLKVQFNFDLNDLEIISELFIENLKNNKFRNTVKKISRTTYNNILNETKDKIDVILKS